MAEMNFSGNFGLEKLFISCTPIFDDFSGSLYTNIKLPGDESWTRVTPSMAREDLEASMRHENLHHQKRMAAKLVPGPRERLSRPSHPPIRLPPPRDPPVSTGAEIDNGAMAGGSNGRRPRWTAPGGAMLRSV